MKSASFIAVIVSLTLGCSQGTPVVLKQYITGSYARSVQNEFSTGNDTLIIAETDNGIYIVDRRLSFRRIKDGTLLPAERKTETWTAFYDEKEAVLKETKQGRILSFQPEHNTLRVGGSEYKKLE